MKNTKKILVASAILLATGISGVQASDLWTTTTATTTVQTAEKEAKELNKEKRIAEKKARKEAREKYKNELKQNSKEKKDFIKTHRAEIKANLKEFRESNKVEMKKAFSTLDKEVKNKLRTDKKELNNAIKTLRTEFKNAKGGLEAREELRNKINELRKSHFETLKTSLSGNEDALKAVEKRVNLFKKNTLLRAESLQKRIDFRWNRANKIIAYKEVFIKKLWDRISRIPTSKLEKLQPKINKFYDKFEKNNKISQEKKDKILSQITALKEIIEERLENIDSESNEFDVETLLN